LLTINCEFRTLEAATAFHPVRVAILAVSCLLTSAIAAQEEVPSPDSQPNILIITADNLGYGDLQSYNPDSKIRTPNLDRRAGCEADRVLHRVSHLHGFESVPAHRQNPAAARTR
jgi:hypothetical protein